MADPADRLSTAVRAEIWSLLVVSDRSQVWLASETGLTTKHINQMLQGHIGIGCEMAERMLACFGRQLAIGTAPLPGRAMPTPLIKTVRRGRRATPPVAAPGETGVAT